MSGSSDRYRPPRADLATGEARERLHRYDNANVALMALLGTSLLIKLISLPEIIATLSGVELRAVLVGGGYFVLVGLLLPGAALHRVAHKQPEGYVWCLVVATLSWSASARQAGSYPVVASIGLLASAALGGLAWYVVRGYFGGWRAALRHQRAARAQRRS